MTEPIHSPTPESVSGEERDIAIVRSLRHWTGSVLGPQYNCKCGECRAIKQVCGLATEALAMKASRRKSRV